MSAAKTTYIRKIGDGLYEYGFLTRAKNFRKQVDVFELAGTASSVAAAEAARAAIAA